MDQNEGLYIDLSDINIRLDKIVFPDKKPTPDPEELSLQFISPVKIGNSYNFKAWKLATIVQSKKTVPISEVSVYLTPQVTGDGYLRHYQIYSESKEDGTSIHGQYYDKLGPAEGLAIINGSTKVNQTDEATTAEALGDYAFIMNTSSSYNYKQTTCNNTKFVDLNTTTIPELAEIHKTQDDSVVSTKFIPTAYTTITLYTIEEPTLTLKDFDTSAEYSLTPTTVKLITDDYTFEDTNISAAKITLKSDKVVSDTDGEYNLGMFNALYLNFSIGDPYYKLSLADYSSKDESYRFKIATISSYGTTYTLFKGSVAKATVYENRLISVDSPDTWMTTESYDNQLRTDSTYIQYTTQIYYLDDSGNEAYDTVMDAAFNLVSVSTTAWVSPIGTITGFNNFLLQGQNYGTIKLSYVAETAISTIGTLTQNLSKLGTDSAYYTDIKDNLTNLEITFKGVGFSSTHDIPLFIKDSDGSMRMVCVMYKSGDKIIVKSTHNIVEITNSGKTYQVGLYNGINNVVMGSGDAATIHGWSIKGESNFGDYPHLLRDGDNDITAVFTGPAIYSYSNGIPEEPYYKNSGYINDSTYSFDIADTKFDTCLKAVNGSDVRTGINI